MATANNSANVSVGKPKAAGAVYWAPIGTAVPTDASSALADAFLNVGFISDAGVTVSTSVDSQSHSAWGGVEVANDVTAYSETVGFDMIERSVNALKLAFGSDAVTASGEEISAVKHTAESFKTEAVLVIETLVGASDIRRTVVPRAKLIERGDIVYKDDELVMYSVKLACLDSDGMTSVDYYAEV